MKNLCSTLFLILFLFSKAYSQSNDSKDVLDLMLEMSSIDQANLGYEPKGYWQRYPHSSDIPHKIIAFDDLLAEPDKLYDFTRVMAYSVEEFLDEDYKGSEGLLKIAYFTGIQHLTSQFRSYNASLIPFDSTDNDPAINAFKKLHHTFDRDFVFHRFGEIADFPRIEYEYRKALKSLHPQMQELLAYAIYQMIDAYRFRDKALKDIDYKDAVSALKIRLLGETQFDGMEFYEEIESIANNIDMNSIYFSGYKLLQLSVEIKNRIKELSSEIDLSTQYFDVNTPIGRIIIDGSGDDTHDYSNSLLLIDISGNDEYRGSAGATVGLTQGISLLIDIDGNDKYINEEEMVISQGAAIFGAAMILDAEGNDEYQSTRIAQGASMFGIGILADLDGDDTYKMWTSGQGGAYFGVGVLIDAKGNDIYNIWGDGQGYGGCGGAGALVDREGDDLYRAEYLATDDIYRPDYHSKDGVHNYTYCQGSGVGRRGDITDGHSWAGGIGTLIDIYGNDKYISGNWSQACGYWYGMGFLYDKFGDDQYESTTWSMACGAHFCISGFFDEYGNDNYKIWYEQGVGMGFGHDFTVATFMDKSGNDSYQLQENGLGYAINKSQVFFYELDGDDSYLVGEKGNNYGWNNTDRENPPSTFSSFHLYTDQISFFADLKGNDSYKIFDFESGKQIEDKRMSNGKTRFYPENKDSLASKRYYGLGIDFDDPDIQIPFMYQDKLKKLNK